ncbi:MAG: flagellar biosynthetic protein FliO [Rubrobacteridae bacterium]|nr:flagellar biosynthetic protein FliO [Rubrobacteridae bacterium]
MSAYKTLIMLSISILITLSAFQYNAIAGPKTETTNKTSSSTSSNPNSKTSDQLKEDKTTDSQLSSAKEDPSNATDLDSEKKVLENSATEKTGAEDILLQKTDEKNSTVSDSKDSRNEKSSLKKKTTPTTEVLLNLGYDDPGEKKKDSSFFGGLLSGIASVVWYILSILFVIALGVFAIYGVKLFSTKYGNFTGAGNDLLNVLEVKYIAPGKAVCLVEVADKVLVLSMTGNNINHLSDITDQDKVNALKLAAVEKKVEPLQPFQVVLDKISKRNVAKKPKRNANDQSQNMETRSQRAKNAGEWQDDLNSTGDNIRKLLDDIANQNKPAKRNRPSSKHGRGGENK